jgi:hypothetical protein
MCCKTFFYKIELFSQVLTKPDCPENRPASLFFSFLFSYILPGASPTPAKIFYWLGGRCVPAALLTP